MHGLATIKRINGESLRDFTERASKHLDDLQAEREALECREDNIVNGWIKVLSILAILGFGLVLAIV